LHEPPLFRATVTTEIHSYGWWLLSALGVGVAALAVRQVVPTGVNVIGLQLGFFASYIRRISPKNDKAATRSSMQT
jgi:hypothetical protein